MPEDKYGVLLHGLVGQTLLVAFVLQGLEDGEQAADGFGEHILAAPFAINIAASGDRLEGAPVGTDQCIDREFVKFDQSHLFSYYVFVVGKEKARIQFSVRMRAPLSASSMEASAQLSGRRASATSGHSMKQ